MYIHVYTCIYMCIHVYINVYTCIYMYIHVYTCMYMYIHVYTFIYTCIHMYIHVYTCIYMYIYVYTCIHVYIHDTLFLQLQTDTNEVRKKSYRGFRTTARTGISRSFLFVMIVARHWRHWLANCENI